MHRLRDLDARDRVLAVVLALLLASPFVASVAKAVHQGYTPTNDEALIALRVDDVLAGHLPRIGQPSTADAYADVDPPHHPGPIEFYLLAGPVGLLGPDVGMLVGAALFNLAAVLVAAWVAFRRAGPAVGLAAAVVVSAVAWSEGLAVLSDPISSNMGGIPLLALVALAWALLDGDLRLVPLAAFAFAFVAQQHLALVTISVGTAAWAAVGIVLALVARARARRAADEPAEAPRAWPWLAGGLVVTLVAWGPVIGDQFWGDGNLGRMLEFARSSDRPTLGPRAGAVQALRALGLPPMIARTDLTGHDLTARLSPVAAVVALAVAVALAAIVVVRWRTARTHATLAATTLVLAVVGGLNGANVPDSIESGRLNFYRWTFVVSIGMVLSLAWAAAALLAARRPAVAESRLGTPVRLAAVGAVLAFAVGAIAVGGPQDRRDEEVFRTSRRLGAAGVRSVEGRKTVLLLMHGQSANLSVGPAVGLDLVEAGHEVRVTKGLGAGWGDHLVLDRGEHVDAVLLVATTKDAFASPLPGRLLRREDLKASLRPVIAKLAAQLRGQPLVYSERGEEIAREQLGGTADQRSLVRYAADALAEKPEGVLQVTAVVKLLQHGYLTSPQLDPDALAVLADSGNTLNWGDDVLEVRRLTVAEAEAATGRTLRG
ncbi:hypothetical protein KSP35_23445 [Aquihabitans sp. G128]|uniref:hypothetical protein n=1 Tax=Aquihabitans sp. G128 TaxID=2849779 RepID=UPI001C23572E|nr:hypothetical protein [Aquihabitans sp. G128]QXC61229.1 hypothetical protein KSP35_23445 [Aquihabitans sp. G128]